MTPDFAIPALVGITIAALKKWLPASLIPTLALVLGGILGYFWSIYQGGGSSFELTIKGILFGGAATGLYEAGKGVGSIKKPS